MSVWKMEAKCSGCPFATDEPGLRQRKALRPARWRGIKRSILQGAAFMCHKTAHEDDEGEHVPSSSDRYCAGALEFEDEHGVSSNYRRVCENLDWAAEQRRLTTEKSEKSVRRPARRVPSRPRAGRG